MNLLNLGSTGSHSASTTQLIEKAYPSTTKFYISGPDPCSLRFLIVNRDIIFYE